MGDGGLVLAVNHGAGSFPHANEEVSESGMVLHDVFGEFAKALFEGCFDVGVILADFLGRKGCGFEKLEGSTLVGCRIGEIHGVEWWFLVGGGGVVSLAGVSLIAMPSSRVFRRGCLAVLLQIPDFLFEKDQRGVGGIFTVEAGPGQFLKQLFHLWGGGKSDLDGLGRVLWSRHNSG